MLRMAEPVRFPIRPDEITPDWLNRALSARLPDMDVARVEVLDQHSGTTGRVRLGLHHAAGSAGPASVFVKLPPFDESQRKLVAATDMGRREARFYAGPATEVPMRIPRSYFAAAGDERTALRATVPATRAHPGGVFDLVFVRAGNGVAQLVLAGVMFPFDAHLREQLTAKVAERLKTT
jgi:hypothetical protein